jgi:hypothetical protein
MALTYTDQGTLVALVAWQKRVAAAASDVAQNTITQLAPNTANYYRLNQLAQEVVKSDALTPAFCRLVAAGFGAGVTALATPAENTGSDTQLRTQVTAAFNALAVI